MVEAILQIFISEQKAEALLSNGFIEFIFLVLFVTFILTFLIHISIFNKLRKIRNYLTETNRMDIEPLQAFKNEFEKRQQQESIKVETFVQEKFSGWRMFQVPVVSLIKMMQMTISVFILIGVLGTFIGLTMALGRIDAGGEQLVEDVASVLAGIDIAFYTSIAGMGLSLLMTVILRAFNTEYLLTDIMLKVESNLVEAEQNGMNRLIEVSEMINGSIVNLQETNQQSLTSIEGAFKGFQEYTTGLQKSAEDLAKFNDGLSSNLEEFNTLFENMKQVTTGFNDATSKLNKNFDQLFTYFKRMDSRNERMVSSFEDTYKKMEEVTTTQQDTLNHFEDSVNDLIQFTSSIADDQQSVKNTFEKINRQSHGLVENMEKQNKEFKRIFGDDLSTKLSGINSYLGDLSKDFDRLRDSMGQLPPAVDTINQIQAEFKHLLADRMDEFRRFNDEFHQHLKTHATESVMFEKQLQDAASTYEQMGVKNNQLISEMNSTISQMNNSFNQRENQIEASVGVLRDTLSKYVMNLEGTLGDKLDKVGRNFGEYVELTNEGIRKEFKDLRMVTEEIQQSSSRYTQQTIRELNDEIQRLNQQLSSFNQQAVRLTGMSRND